MTEEEKLTYSADLPLEIIKPVLERLYVRDFRDIGQNLKNGRFPGIAKMSETLGITDKVIREILRGERKSVTIDECDKITLFADEDLNTLFEDTIEWSMNHPEKGWPELYQSNKKYVNGGTFGHGRKKRGKTKGKN